MEDNKLVGNILTANKYLIRVLERGLKEYNLTNSEFSVLDILIGRGNLPIQVMANIINLTSGTMTYLINKLVKKGYVTRVQNNQDSRVFELMITEEGRTFHENMIGPFGEYLHHSIHHSLDEEEKVELNRLLDKFVFSMKGNK